MSFVFDYLSDLFTRLIRLVCPARVSSRPTPRAPSLQLSNLDPNNIPDGVPVVYVLDLEDNCRYIGKTCHWPQRYLDHRNRTSCTWVKLHRLVRVRKVFLQRTIFDEEALTKHYMVKAGIQVGLQTVRGSSYCQAKLNAQQIARLMTDLSLADDKRCYNCYKQGHWANKCPRLLSTGLPLVPENTSS